MKLSLCLPATSWDPEWFLKCLFPFVNWCNTQGIETDLATWNERGNMSLMRERLAVGSPKLINDWTMNTPWNGKRAYDYMLWIDSDIRFEPADFQRLPAGACQRLPGGLAHADRGACAADASGGVRMAQAAWPERRAAQGRG